MATQSFKEAFYYDTNKKKWRALTTFTHPVSQVPPLSSLQLPRLVLPSSLSRTTTSAPSASPHYPPASAPWQRRCPSRVLWLLRSSCLWRAQTRSLSPSVRARHALFVCAFVEISALDECLISVRGASEVKWYVWVTDSEASGVHEVHGGSMSSSEALYLLN